MNSTEQQYPVTRYDLDPAARSVPPNMQGLLDFSPDVICTISRAGRFLYVSAAAKAVWGYDPCELKGKSFVDFVCREDWLQTLQAAENVINGSTLINFQNHYQCKDGSIKPVLWSARWNADEEVIYCVARDGTEQHKATQTEKAYQQRLQRAYKLAQIGWWEWNSNGRQLHVAAELYDIYGLAKSENPPFSIELFLSLVHPGDRMEVLKNFSLVGQLPCHQFSHRIVRPSGATVYVAHYIETVRNAANKVIRVHGTTKNVTHQKKAEAALRESRSMLENIVESLGDGFYALDQNLNITYWNKKAEQITQKKRQEVLGRKL